MLLEVDDVRPEEIKKKTNWIIDLGRHTLLNFFKNGRDAAKEVLPIEKEKRDGTRKIITHNLTAQIKTKKEKKIKSN